MPLSVVILAAGQGKRMKSDLPKVLQPLAGRPLLKHVIDAAHGVAADGIHVVYGHGVLQYAAAPERIIAEAHRVLKPGGRFLCLEFSRVALPVLDRLYDAYSFTVLPLLGRLVAGNADAYRYLAESIRRFPPQERFAGMIRDAGFELVKYRNLSGGIVAMHSAWRT